MNRFGFFAAAIGGVFLSGTGVGMLVAWFGNKETAPVVLIAAGAACIGLGAFLFWRASQVKAGDPDGEVGDAELFLGDMNDPVQRRILIRVAAAGAVHAIVVMRFLAGDTPVAGWQPVAEYAAFVLTLGWIVIECINFHRIDEFWTRIALVPAALSGVILFFAVTCWLAAEKVLGAPEAPFWSFYLLYYVSLVAILIGRQKFFRVQA